MSSFKHHRNNNHRYNFYESQTEVIAPKNFYLLFRNTLFFIALILSLLVTSLISFDTYKKIKNRDSRILLIKKVEENQLKEKITNLEFTQIISNTIIKKIDKDNSFENINHQQLKRIIKNIMEKIENSPNQIIYTQR